MLYGSISRHLSILKAAGLVAERRDANHIFYSLVEDRLATCVGGFLSAVCPEQVVLGRRRATRPGGRAAREGSGQPGDDDGLADGRPGHDRAGPAEAVRRAVNTSTGLYLRCPLWGLATGAPSAALVLWPARTSVARAWLHT